MKWSQRWVHFTLFRCLLPLSLGEAIYLKFRVRITLRESSRFEILWLQMTALLLSVAVMLISV